MHVGTSRTMSLMHWRAAVLEEAHVSEEDADRYATRERVVRWYDAGEPVWMAAKSLRSFVVLGKQHDRADREVEYLASKMNLKS